MTESTMAHPWPLHGTGYLSGYDDIAIVVGATVAVLVLPGRLRRASARLRTPKDEK